jgi:hypothetical protein
MVSPDRRQIKDYPENDGAATIIFLRQRLRSPDAAQRHQRVYARLRRAIAVRC